jgi:hypothetical protein
MGAMRRQSNIPAYAQQQISEAEYKKLLASKASGIVQGADGKYYKITDPTLAAAYDAKQKEKIKVQDAYDKCVSDPKNTDCIAKAIAGFGTSDAARLAKTEFAQSILAQDAISIYYEKKEAYERCIAQHGDSKCSKNDMYAAFLQTQGQYGTDPSVLDSGFGQYVATKYYNAYAQAQYDWAQCQAENKTTCAANPNQALANLRQLDGACGEDSVSDKAGGSQSVGSCTTQVLIK